MDANIKATYQLGDQQKAQPFLDKERAGHLSSGRLHWNDSRQRDRAGGLIPQKAGRRQGLKHRIQRNGTVEYGRPSLTLHRSIRLALNEQPV
jgi:hypothetical protein